eukprot:CAMPEP_0197307116 /NCGR_PEP_ID=MMETSP0891-20130614/4546_1 /TAXON_ID=44058 ORGANISM="Aureoumbra lagunensis, Strain CCMP1510" /NCGR_SAMPLE_ID=MMETSP0891 /ASSEMBLY_ACC=CAM_ASM_000534 /LENGTH=182 /DNA_ID=CAMNT_0042790129 /DNA_START=68 /DNA_END=616 /DNA_ORIENTATION=+
MCIMGYSTTIKNFNKLKEIHEHSFNDQGEWIRTDEEGNGVYRTANSDITKEDVQTLYEEVLRSHVLGTNLQRVGIAAGEFLALVLLAALGFGIWSLAPSVALLKRTAKMFYAKWLMDDNGRMFVGGKIFKVACFLNLDVESNVRNEAIFYMLEGLVLGFALSVILESIEILGLLGCLDFYIF